MSNELAVPIYSVTDMERMAQAFAKSNLFGVKTVDQALALMLLSQAEGLHPATAARDYHIIQGRPALKAELVEEPAEADPETSTPALPSGRPVLEEGGMSA